MWSIQKKLVCTYKTYLTAFIAYSSKLGLWLIPNCNVNRFKRKETFTIKNVAGTMFLKKLVGLKLKC